MGEMRWTEKILGRSQASGRVSRTKTERWCQRVSSAVRLPLVDTQWPRLKCSSGSCLLTEGPQWHSAGLGLPQPVLVPSQLHWAPEGRVSVLFSWLTWSCHQFLLHHVAFSHS